MSSLSDPDVETLISHLAGPLTPADRVAFRAAAEDARTRVPCSGEGIIYRTVAALQRAYFQPPTGDQAAWSISRDRRNKLSSQPPIASGRDRRFKRFRVS